MFAILLPILGLGMIFLAATHAHHSAWWCLLAWMGLSFFVIGLAYAGAGPRIFGKTAQGRRRVWVYPLLTPFLVYVRLVTWIRHRLSREPAAHEVLPNIWLAAGPAAHRSRPTSPW